MASSIIRSPLKRVDALIEKLPMADKVRLVQRLERQTWEARFKDLVKQIRSQAKARPISDLGIRQICEAVRQRRHDQSCR